MFLFFNMFSMRSFVFGISLFYFLSLGSGCSGSGPVHRPAAAPSEMFPDPATASLAEVTPTAAEQLYRGLCASCHGLDGRAETPLSRELSPAPSDLTSCIFKFRRTPSGSLPLPEDLLRTLYIGLPGSAMPSLGGLLPLPDLRGLARQVRAFCPRFATLLPEPAVEVPAPPLYDEASTVRGARVYAAQGCAGCHGPQGQGDGPAATTLRETRGRPIRPRDFRPGIFRSGLGRADLYRTLATGLDGTPMPGLAQELPAEQRWDLVHFVVSRSAGRSRVLRYLERGSGWLDPVEAWSLPWR